MEIMDTHSQWSLAEGPGCVDGYEWAGIQGSGCSGFDLMLDQDESIKILNRSGFTGLLVGNGGSVHWPLKRRFGDGEEVVGAE